MATDITSPQHQMSKAYTTKLADGDVGLTKCYERQEEDIAVDATKPHHLAATAAS